MNSSPAVPLTVILNPAAGSVEAPGDVEAAIREVLPGATIAVGREAGDLERLAARERSRGVHTLIAAGGDGSLNEVLNGALESDEPLTLGLLPLGTGNDFARTLELPTDLREALAVIRDGKAAPLDVIRVSGAKQRFMINVSAGGFAGVVDEKLTPELKAAWGPLAYLRGMIESLDEMEHHSTTVAIDSAAPEKLWILNMVVANARYVARGIPIAPEADPADGLIDLVAILDARPAELALLAPLVISGTHLDHERIVHRRGRKIEIQAHPPMTFNADGEKFGDGDITFEVMPGAVSFLRPAGPAD